jgi:thiol-disulfide isomerase/thioredoxin
VIVVVVATLSSQPRGIVSPAASSEQPIAAPDFRLSLYQGAEVLGAEELEFSSLFDQGKPVVLNFWAGLCPPCRAEMPGFQRVYDELGDQFILLGLDIGPFIGLGSREDGQRLLEELGITYPAGTTFEEVTVAKYNVRGMPTTVFLTASGEIYDTTIGLIDEQTLRSKVESLIQEAGGA